MSLASAPPHESCDSRQTSRESERPRARAMILGSSLVRIACNAGQWEARVFSRNRASPLGSQKITARTAGAMTSVVKRK
jgi:hypothetical protein